MVWYCQKYQGSILWDIKTFVLSQFHKYFFEKPLRHMHKKWKSPLQYYNTNLKEEHEEVIKNEMKNHQSKAIEKLPTLEAC